MCACVRVCVRACVWYITHANTTRAHTGQCEWPFTSTFDCIIEIFFILEIIAHFFTGAYDEKGTYVDNLRYFRSWC